MSHRNLPAGPALVQPIRELSVVEAVTRAVCMIDELAILPDLVDEIEAARESQSTGISQNDLATRIRELLESIRFHARLVTDILSRLERIAGSE